MTLALRTPVVLVVQVATASDQPMPVGPARLNPGAVPKALLMALYERRANLVQAIVNGPADRVAAVRRLEVVRVQDAVLPNPLQKAVALPIAREQVVVANDPGPFRVAVHGPLNAVFVVPKQEHLARAPAFDLAPEAPRLLGFHRGAQAGKRLIPGLNVVLVPGALHLHGTGAVVHGQRRHVPMVADVNYHVRHVVHDGLRDPVDMGRGDAGTHLRIRHNEMALWHAQSPVSVAGSFSGGFAPKSDRYAVPWLIPIAVAGSGSSAASPRSIISRSIGSASNSTARCSTGGGPNASGLTARISLTTRIAHESVGHHVWTL